MPNDCVQTTVMQYAQSKLSKFGKLLFFKKTIDNLFFTC